MAGSLTPPDVIVSVSTPTSSVSVRTPRLQSCLIGPCIQLVDAVDSDGEINSDALAGTYSGSAATYDYPNLITHAEPITTYTKVYFRYGNAADLVELDDDEFTCTTTAVTISGNAQGITPASNIKVNVYIQYQALRLDVAPVSDNNVNGTRTGVVIEQTDDITTDLGLVDTRNPLGLAAHMAKLNAPNTSIMCLGVEDVTVLAPEGTSVAYASALEFAETIDPYTLVPLTQSASVHSLFPTHVDSMSGSTGRKERIALLNGAMPDTSADETQASGDYGRITAAGKFETAGDLTDVSEDDKLLIDGDATVYNIDSISGSEVTVTPATMTPDSLDHEWEIYTPGAAITSRSAIADAYAAIGESYANKRIFYFVPDIVEIDLDGVTEQVKGYYACAAVAGLIGELKPQQPLTNYPISGLVGLDGSNDYFTPSQLNTIAGGGMFILVQDSTDALIKSRMQLSTDVSTIEYREMSITKAVDYGAKCLRMALRPLLGRNVITSRFINMRLTPVISGILEQLLQAEVFTSAKIVSLTQSTTSPDTILATIRVGVPYPCNYIYITLEI